MNIIITGGTGFVGRSLIPVLLERGDAVWVVTRDVKQGRAKLSHCNAVTFVTDIHDVGQDIEIHAIINLAGEPIADKRWSAKQKSKLVNSRLDATNAIEQFCASREMRPGVLLSASAIGYYGSHGDEPLTEAGSFHDEFTHTLCEKWEAAALSCRRHGVRVCVMRFGVVLGPNGGILKKLHPAFKFGLGGRLGHGKQFLSWIHIQDLIHAIVYLLDSRHLAGTFNLTAPYPLRNAEFTKALAKQHKRQAFMHLPSPLVKLLFGEMGEVLLLSGQRVVPEHLSEAGFVFLFPELRNALQEICES